MRIGIDARLINETGVGRYIRNLISELAVIDKDNTYYLFLRRVSYTSYNLPGENFHKVLAEVPWHTLQEQLIMPKLFASENLDLVHIPYFNIPILYPGKIIVTIHDLTILHFATGKATTLPLWLYQIRRLGYRLILALGLRKALQVIAVSQTTKREVLAHFHLPSSKVTVIYEGVDKLIGKPESKNPSAPPLVESKYFLYVGNAYPHKNLELLLQAFKELRTKGNNSGQNLKLVLVGRQDYFYKKLKEAVDKDRLSQKVVFWGEASDRQLTNLYRNALALIFPSLMEGFGLPAIEALRMGCPVICSDIPVFHEILGKTPVYFRADSASSLTLKMDQSLDRPRQIQEKFNFSLYSWERTARKTLEIYENCFSL